MNELWDIGASQASDWNLEGRLAICGGTRSVSAQEIKSGFKRAARVPLDDWRSPNPAEVKRLEAANDSGPSANRISIVRLPIPLTDQLRVLLRDGKEPLKDEFCNFVQACFSPGESPIWLGYAWNEGGLITLSRDDRRGKFNGLHVDSWDGEPLAGRAGSRNRICFNIGVEPRHLLFVPVSLARIAGWFRTYYPEEGLGKVQASTIARTYLKRNPGTPVIRLAVQPGEAYIAPTENMIHDGTTLHAGNRVDPEQFRDEEITLRGHFVQSTDAERLTEPL